MGLTQWHLMLSLMGRTGVAASQVQTMSTRLVAEFLLGWQVMLWMSSVGTSLASAWSVTKVPTGDGSEVSPCAVTPKTVNW